MADRLAKGIHPSEKELGTPKKEPGTWWPECRPEGKGCPPLCQPHPYWDTGSSLSAGGCLVPQSQAHRVQRGEAPIQAGLLERRHSGSDSLQRLLKRSSRTSNTKRASCQAGFVFPREKHFCSIGSVVS